MQLTYANLVTDQGAVNLTVLKAMARRRAMNESGAVTPRSLRTAVRYYGEFLPGLLREKRRALGLPVDAGVAVNMGHAADGVSREA